MNLSSIREGELKDVFDAVEEAFNAIGTDYYIIGALAKDIWYSRGSKTMRQTKDVDFAVLAGSQKDYEAVKQYLKENKNFVDTKGKSFVMLTPSGVQVDILPFGEIEIDDGVSITGGGLTSIKVNGFMEVYQSGTEEVEMETGHNFMTISEQLFTILWEDVKHRRHDTKDMLQNRFPKPPGKFFLLD